MLMQAGIAYDSEESRAICGAITAIMTGRSYATSAQMAGQMGPYPGYFKNREHMLRVIRNHRRAAYGVPRDSALARDHDLSDYEGLQIKPVPVDKQWLTNRDQNSDGGLANGELLGDRARACWDDALYIGRENGYRNAQTTVIAPTGTIGLLMDCDTTGVEPDFALVKFKKLAGGGYFKIANQSLKPALENLRYDERQVKDMLDYVMGTLHLDVAMPDDPKITFSQWLKEKGLTHEDLKKVVDTLSTVFELPFAFNAWTLGQETIDRLGLTEQAKESSFNLLVALGLSKPNIAQLNAKICGALTIEGAPYLNNQHLAVFDCANTCGPTGERFIAAEGHIRMMAAAQPFISGAISKTINLPNTATVDDIKSAYRLSWELALKANALYRDGCKLSQPLNSKVDVDDEVEDEEGIEAAKLEVTAEVAQVAAQAGEVTFENGEKIRTVEKIVEKIVERPLRRRLPDTRNSLTHKFNVAGHEGYLTVGLYDDATPGELFITMAKEGSTIGGLMDSLGTAISVALQYGVPMDQLVNKFTHQRFEPAGMTHNPDIPFAKSLVDYIFRWMGMEFVPGYRAANAPARPSKAKPETRAAAKPLSDRVVTSPSTPGNEGSGGKAASSVAEESIVDSSRRTLTKSEPTSPASTIKEMANAVDSGMTISAMTAAMTHLQADAPACDLCGTITVRSGTCYKCLNCGNSMGCS
jgi:ribonucleoside-diphosphate reductase alpha chain